MSSRDLRVALGALVLAATLALAACGGPGTPGTDETTAALARLQADHLCALRQANASTEEAIADGLRSRLEQAGLGEDEWRDWRESLVDAPARAAELAEHIRKRSGCAN